MKWLGSSKPKEDEKNCKYGSKTFHKNKQTFSSTNRGYLLGGGWILFLNYYKIYTTVN